MANELNRRDFHKLTTAAFAGLLGGSLVGCGDGGNGNGKQTGGGGKDGLPEEPIDPAPEDIDPTLLAEEPHVCRGLNTCKGHGKNKTNECAGQGSCATAEKHICNGQNDCKGQGGCGQYPGQNTCDSKGACAVPLTDKTWKIARAKFEEVMKEKGVEVGPAPEN